MTKNELLELMDESAEECIHTLGLSLYEKFEDNVELNEQEIPVFILWMWNIEMLNGGLCQFFVNEGRFAPLVPAALEAVGASAYASLLNDFVARHKIDFNDLSQFELDLDPTDVDFSAYTAASELYPFDAFDEAFAERYGTDPLEAYMAAYIRENIISFTEE